MLAEIEMMRVKVKEEHEKLKYVEVKVLAEQLGSEYVGFERMLAQSVKAQVPQIISGGGGTVDTLLDAMPMAKIMDLLKDWQAQLADGKKLSRQDELKPIETGEGEVTA